MDCQFVMGMAAWIAYTSFVKTAEFVVPVGRLVSAAHLLDTNDQKVLLNAVQAMLQAGAGAGSE